MEVKAWKTLIQTGPDQITSVCFLLWDERGRVGQTWALTLAQAEGIFGKEAIDTIPLLPNMSGAVVAVELRMKVLS